MAAVRRCVLACALLLLAGAALQAASPTEKTAWDAAAKAFRETFWDRAETEFGNFAQTYTNSSRLPEAWLYQAEARLKQKNYAGALELLNVHQPQAGKMADSYLFWQAETLFEKGELEPAAAAFGRLLSQFPGSTNSLPAVVRQATAWSKLAQWSRVIENLQTPGGPFHRAVVSQADTEQVVRGYLLLAEAHLAQTNCPAATAALAPAASLQLGPELEWERQYLACRIQLAAGAPEKALSSSTNLFSLAGITGQHRLVAETAAFIAGLHERLGQPDAAIAAYQKNLAPGLPPERQRDALLKITQLMLRQDKIADAARTLETFLTNYPAAESRDVALATLGELRLRQFETGSCTNVVSILTTNLPAATNCLQLAQTALQGLVDGFPKSPLLGRGELYLGWCLWRQDEVAPCRDAFQKAVQHLPFSAEQAIAYFKLAEAQYRLTNYAAAIENYRAVVDKFGGLPEVQTNLVEPALYHMVRAALGGNQLSAATNAVAKLLASHPRGFYTDRSVLLTYQVLGRQNPAGAREIFQAFLKAYPEAPLRPEIELAIAATYEQDKLWDEAIHQYDAWLGDHTNHTARARAEYARALANFQAGRDTNALTLFTNFIAHFPNDPSAPLAQWWVGDYYFRAGDYYSAEQNYQWCYQNTNWPTSPLTYEAIMMSGRAAFARQGWKDARDYFSRLAGNTNCDAALRAQAFFAIGDTLVSQASTNKLADYKEALSAYDQVGWLCPSNQLAFAALGAKANCFLQCQDYAGATNAYQRVVDSSLADVVCRGSAKVGLGLAFEKLAGQPNCTNQAGLLIAARDQYLDVFDNRDFLREGEKADPFWTMKAGLEAARLTETMKQPRQARRVYEELRQQFPWLRLQEKITALELQEKEARDKS